MPLSGWHMPSGQFPDVLAIAIASVAFRCVGWTDYQLQASSRRHPTCYHYLTGFSVV